MFYVKDVLVSQTLKTLRFHCSLEKCLGQCCVLGDLGCPLQRGEIEIIEENLDQITERLAADDQDLIRRDGFIYVEQGQSYTRLRGGNGPCCFVYEQNGIALCAIEAVFNDGGISFRKPLSCHLFPLILVERGNVSYLTAVNRMECFSAFGQGGLLVEFCREALIRAFSEAWYAELISIVKTSPD